MATFKCTLPHQAGCKLLLGGATYLVGGDGLLEVPEQHVAWFKAQPMVWLRQDQDPQSTDAPGAPAAPPPQAEPGPGRRGRGRRGRG